MSLLRTKNPFSYRRPNRYYLYRCIALMLVPVVGYFSGMVQDFIAEPNSNSIKGKAIVKDGDTVNVDGVDIRIYGLDAPELKQSCKKDGKEWKCGQEAKKQLEKIIGDKEIFCIPLDEDRYKREASNCYFISEVGKINIGQQMVINGWALAYETYSPRYILNEYYAKFSGKGIWTSQFSEPRIWRKYKGG